MFGSSEAFPSSKAMKMKLLYRGTEEEKLLQQSKAVLTELTTATGTHIRAKRDMPPLKAPLSRATIARSIVVVRFNITTSREVRAMSNPATVTFERKAYHLRHITEGGRKTKYVTILFSS